MSVTEMIAALAVVALFAWVAWLLARNNSGGTVQHPQNVCCHPLHTRIDVVCTQRCEHDHGHEHVLPDHQRPLPDHEHPHDHDDEYSSVGHDHDDRYADVNHDHDKDYPKLGDTVSWAQFNLVVTRLAQLERQLKDLQAPLVRRLYAILLGMLFGGLIGWIVGFILDLTLPRRFFQILATTTFNVEGKIIPRTLMADNHWPMWGIPLGCAFAGMILGGITLLVVSIFRSRRQSASKEG